jgi:hypothetical protein
MPLKRLKSFHKTVKKSKTLYKNPKTTKHYRQNILDTGAITEDNHSRIRISDSFDDTDEMNHAQYENSSNEINNSNDIEYHDESQRSPNITKNTNLHILEVNACVQFREAGIYDHFKSPVGGEKSAENCKDMIMRAIRFLIWLHFFLYREQIDLIKLSAIEFFVTFVKR